MAAPLLTAIESEESPTGLFSVDITDAIPPAVGGLGLSALVFRVTEVDCSNESTYYFLEALVSRMMGEARQQFINLVIDAFCLSRISRLTCRPTHAGMFLYRLLLPAWGYPVYHSSLHQPIRASMLVCVCTRMCVQVYAI